MFNQCIDACKEACIQELWTSKNERIKKLMKMIEDETPMAFKEDGLSSIMADILANIIGQGIEDESEQTEFTIMALDTFLKGVIELKTMYTFKVSLKGLEDEFNRTIRLSSSMRLSDLGYLILASFQVEAPHLFYFEIRKEKYACDSEFDYMDSDEEYDAASDYEIAELALKKNTKITFHYDYGNDYNFSVTLMNIEVDNDLIPSLENTIIDGKGYGIWEDAHYELDLFYEDEKKFNAFLEENKIDKKNYPTDMKFDLEECRETVGENYFAIKYAYEIGDEDMQEDENSLLM